jgi:hypothetical protein
VSLQPAAEPEGSALSAQLELLLARSARQEAQALADREEARLEREQSAKTTALLQEQLQASLVSSANSAAAIAGLSTSLISLKEDYEALKKKKASEDDDEVADKPFCPHYESENPHPQRDKFRKNEQPALYTPANKDETFDLLLPGGEALNAAGWEYRHRLAECSFTKDIILHLEKVLPRVLERLREPTKEFKSAGADGVVIDVEDDIVHLLAVYNSIDGVYTNLLNKRCSLLQLKAILYHKFPGDKNKDKRESLLQILEDDVYGVFGGALPANTDAIFAAAIEKYKVKVQEAKVKKAVNAGAGTAKAGAGGKGALGQKVAQQPKADGA